MHLPAVFSMWVEIKQGNSIWGTNPINHEKEEFTRRLANLF